MENETGAHMATEIKAGDTVECIRANGSPKFDDVCPVGQRRKVVRVSYETMWLEGSDQYVSANRFKIVEPPPVIDWTKPLQWHNGSGHQIPVRLVGRDGDQYIIAREYAGDTRYVPFPENGVNPKDGFVTNVPPPPLWPVKRWFVSWLDHGGKPQVSGQTYTEGQAKIFAARLETGGHKDVWIKEVTFG